MSTAAGLLANPYVGPRPFRYGEALYGRRRETFELYDRLVADRILLLSSPSGAGKTSLIQAGLRPRLEHDGFDVLPVMRVSHRPPPGVTLPAATNRYTLSLLISLEQAADDERKLPIETLCSLSLEEYLARRSASRVGTPAGAGQPVSEVLILDQFEEILTQSAIDRAAKQQFFAAVGSVLKNRDRWAVVAIREEYVNALSPYVDLVPTQLASVFRLDLLGLAAAHEAIVEPARKAGGVCSDTIADALVAQLSMVREQQPGGEVADRPGPLIEPMQLQVVCRLLWQGGNGTIDENTLNSIGSVDRALALYLRRPGGPSLGDRRHR